MKHFKLLAVDGLNLVRRVYEANPAPDSPEKATSALKASLGSLKRALRTHQPSHCFIAFDAGGLTWRHAIYADYRKDRKPMPQPLKDALPGFIQSLRELGFCVRQIEGVEADDSLATVVNRAHKAGVTTVVLSTDKDLLWLLDEGVQVYDHFNEAWRTPEWMLTKFGVTPKQLPDWLALVGDSTDSIPGVEGVGAKTAAKLLSEHGNLEGVLKASASLKGKVAERLSTHADLARISLQLATLKLDVDVDIESWSQLRCPELEGAL